MSLINSSVKFYRIGSTHKKNGPIRKQFIKIKKALVQALKISKALTWFSLISETKDWFWMRNDSEKTSLYLNMGYGEVLIEQEVTIENLSGEGILEPCTVRVRVGTGLMKILGGESEKITKSFFG